MALETAVNIADLVMTNPTANDPKSQGDDHLRTVKTVLKNNFAGFTGAVLVTGTDGGAADVYTLTPAHAVVAYTSKMLILFAPTITNLTTTPTLNVSGLGAKTIKSVAGAALTAGDLVADKYYLGEYDGASINLIAVTKNYVDQLAFSAALPAQTGNAGKILSTDGAGASWTAVVLPQVHRSPRTANSALASADRGNLIDITSGTFTQTLTAAATLGAGWYCFLRNSGTGDITLDPNAAELIDGLTSYIMYPGEARLVQCDGTALTSVVVSKFSRAFASSATFIRPPGYSYFDTELRGAGGSGGSGSCGGGATTKSGGAGGGGGGYTRKLLTAAEIGTSISVTIGAGGALAVGATTAIGNNGGTGGNSAIGSVLTVTGGLGGAGGAGTATTAGGVGGSAPGATSDYYLGAPGGQTGNSTSSAGLGRPHAGAGGGGGGGEFSDDSFISAGPPKAGGTNAAPAGGGGSAGASAAGAPVAGGAGATLSGGGGGGASTTVAAAAGGAGGIASGGGGGGSSRTPFASGAGGAGGPGYCSISGV